MIAKSKMMRYEHIYEIIGFAEIWTNVEFSAFQPFSSMRDSSLKARSSFDYFQEWIVAYM